MLHVVKGDTPQGLRILLLRATILKTNRLIAAQARASIDEMRAADKGDVLPATHDKERARLRPAQQPPKVVVAAIHDVERTRLRNQLVQERRIGDFCRGNPHKTGNVAAHVHQRVQLDGGLLTLGVGPRKQRQTQLDHRRVERVNRVFQSDRQRLLGIQLSSTTNQTLERSRERFASRGVRWPGPACCGQSGHENQRGTSFARIARRHVSTSRKLSRYVSCANTIAKN